MLFQKNKLILNIIFLIIFIISITYTTFLYVKGDNVVISKNSYTPIDIFLYSPSNDDIGISLISSLSTREESYLTIMKELFLGDKKIEHIGSQNKLTGYSFRSVTFNFNYLGNIKNLKIDYDNFNNFLWKNFKKQFEFEMAAYQNISLIQKDNYNKITKDFNKNKSIDELTDYDITSCKFNLSLEDFDTQSFVSKEDSLDYLCEIEISKKYEKNKETFFKLIRYEVFIRDAIDIASSRKYNAKYIVYSFIAFISFLFLLFFNISKRDK